MIFFFDKGQELDERRCNFMKDFFKSRNDEELKISQDTCFKTAIFRSGFLIDLCH